MEKVNIGIDLGTTYSAVATFNKNTGKTIIYRNSLNSETTPSVLYIENNKVLFGEEAKSEQKSGNTNTVSFYKSMMGNVNYSCYLDGKEYSAEELSGIFLKELINDIKATNNIEVEGAVITVPAYFNDKQREATIRAGQKAGLKVLKIINEPTAAIIAYGLTSGKDKNVLVYDLGGGTFDVTIAHVKGTKIDVMATNGNHQLGGKDWDQILIDIIKDRFYQEFDVSIENSDEDMKELQVKAEEAKKRLSSMTSTEISIQSSGYTGKYEITREEFNDKTSSLLEETILLIKSCFEEISENENRNFSWKDIDEVILVGGSTRMPQVKEMILKEYGKAPITKDINVDTIVAQGAAMQAELCKNAVLTLKVVKKDNNNKPVIATLTINNKDIEDITSHGLGMLSYSSDNKDIINSIIIRKNSKVNKLFSRNYSFKGDKLEVYVLQGESKNPYEVDILGKYIITGMNKEIKNDIVVNFLYNQNGIVEVTASLKNGTVLDSKKEVVTETMEEIINRLKGNNQNSLSKGGNYSKVEVKLFIDVSGSMRKENRLVEAKKAAREFVNQFPENNIYISLISFADSLNEHCSKEINHKTIFNKIDEIDICDAGHGNLSTPINTTKDSFSKDSCKIMVILTDGRWVNKISEIKASNIAKGNGVIIYGIGICDADEEFLRAISSGYGKKVDLSKLTSTFKEVANSIATEVVGNSLTKI